MLKFKNGYHHMVIGLLILVLIGGILIALGIGMSSYQDGLSSKGHEWYQIIYQEDGCINIGVL